MLVDYEGHIYDYRYVRSSSNSRIVLKGLKVTKGIIRRCQLEAIKMRMYVAKNLRRVN